MASIKGAKQRGQAAQNQAWVETRAARATMRTPEVIDRLIIAHQREYQNTGQCSLINGWHYLAAPCPMH